MLDRSAKGDMGQVDWPCSARVNEGPGSAHASERHAPGTIIDYEQPRRADARTRPNVTAMPDAIIARHRLRSPKHLLGSAPRDNWLEHA